MLKLSNILEKIYYLLIVVVLFVIVDTAHLVQSNIKISDTIVIREEYIESSILIILLLVGYVLFKLYKREVIKNQDKLNEAFNYIGQLNVQIQEINKVFGKVKNFPENKKELKKMMNFFTAEALAIIDADWTLVRIIDVIGQNTLQEYVQTRGNSVLLKYEISNKMLMAGEAIDGYSVVTSEQNNLGLKAFFVFPIENINKEQRILIKALINQLEMVFIVFNSRFIRNN